MQLLVSSHPGVHGWIVIFSISLYLVSTGVGLSSDVVGKDFINALFAHEFLSPHL